MPSFLFKKRLQRKCFLVNLGKKLTFIYSTALDDCFCLFYVSCASYSLCDLSKLFGVPSVMYEDHKT